MIMVCHIMAVTVHGPVEVCFEAVRMTVGLNHFQMILDRFKNIGCVGKGRYHGPDNQCHAGQHGEETSRDVLCVDHGPTALRG